MGVPGGSDGKESACNKEDMGLIPGLERPPGEGYGNPTPVFSPGGSHGQRNLAGYSLLGCTQLDITEASEHTHSIAALQGWFQVQHGNSLLLQMILH